ncbi:uncharacterized protein LOC117331325 [Pecten maximus]|uniref:uncharacterized protein LOC117331325 n=1 Tax=Pecten maximus TaxID=6579 RepID=UPI0014591308|nr:uncharacterized protein LOC117331325 [Pecten maximus]
MATTLPRITPLGTPVPRAVSSQPRSFSTPPTPSIYGPYPPRELSSSMDNVYVPGRINPLAPPPSKRRINMSWETSEQHLHNHKRSQLMQRREHERYHSAWAKAFYGSVAEQEYYRKHFRDVLKQQMADIEDKRKKNVKEKKKESEMALAQDDNDKSNDRDAFRKKHRYLQTFRDSNKQTMEEKWSDNKVDKFIEDRSDRDRGRYNPINWTCSLK